MFAEFQGRGWTAEVLANDEPNPSGFVNLQIRTLGDTADSALSSATMLLGLFAFGREAVIRVEPKVASERDFDTKVMVHVGTARCSVRMVAGEWHKPEREPVTIGFGLA